MKNFEIFKKFFFIVLCCSICMKESFDLKCRSKEL